MTNKLLSILTGLFLFLLVPALNAQAFTEDFDYATGSLLTDNGWTAHSGSTTQAVDVTNGLSFAGFKGSDTGGAANLDNDGEDVHATFTAYTSGTVYVAAMVKIDAPGAAGYFFHLGKTTIGTAFFSRVWVNAEGDGIGLTSGKTAPTQFASITPGQPFLLVLKYDFAAKKSSLFALDAFAATEPASAAIQIDETNTEIGSVALRQYNAGQRIIVDGIRVGTAWAEAVEPAGAVTKVYTPNFTPAGGNYSQPVEVSIATATEGATVYYTLDGSEPDNTKTPFTVPFTVSTTTTVKAKAYKSGLDASNVASVTYNFPVNVANIAELRAADVSGIYRLSGEVIMTLKSTEDSRKPKYIQDATGGLLIDDASGIITTNYNAGDGITGLTGTLGAYAGMLQFVPVADPGVATSTGNTVTPKEVTLETIRDYPGQLVTLSGVSINAEGNFAARTNYNLNNQDVVILRTAYNDLPYVGTAIPQGALDITGVVLWFNATTQIVPRTISDFMPSTLPVLTSTEVMSLFGAEQGETVKDTIYVNGSNLTSDVILSLSGDGAAAFSVEPATIAPVAGKVENVQVVISYQPTGTSGEHSAVLTLSAAGVSDVVLSLSGRILAMAGDGSQSDPFTVSDVITLANSLGTAQKYWVKGYITGSVGSGENGVLTVVTTTAPFSNSSLVLATSASETNPALMIPVNLPASSDVRAALNLVDNPVNQGKEVVVYGTLEAYFSAPGVRNVSEYSLLTALPGVDSDKFSIVAYQGHLQVIADSDASIELINTVGQVIYSDRLNAGHNMISVAQSGILLVKIDGTVTKVIL